MGKPDPGIDACIANAAQFAHPILAHLRAVVDFSPGQQRGYVEWLSDAKREATRARRLATTLEWLAEGDARNWKCAAR